MGAPRSLCIDQKAGSVMSQENALTDSSSPQKAISPALLTAVVPGPSPRPTPRSCDHTWITRPKASDLSRVTIAKSRSLHELGKLCGLVKDGFSQLLVGQV